MIAGGAIGSYLGYLLDRQPWYYGGWPVVPAYLAVGGATVFASIAVLFLLVLRPQPVSPNALWLFGLAAGMLLPEMAEVINAYAIHWRDQRAGKLFIFLARLVLPPVGFVIGFLASRFKSGIGGENRLLMVLGAVIGTVAGTISSLLILGRFPPHWGSESGFIFLLLSGGSAFLTTMLFVVVTSPTGLATGFPVRHSARNDQGVTQQAK